MGLSLSNVAIRRHIGTLMLTLTVIVLGVFFIFRLQVDLLPSITYPRVGVRLDVPGVAPEVAEEEVTKPLEEALAATEGVVQLSSQTREGQVSVDLYFNPGQNIDQALNDVTASVNRSRSALPEVAEQPRIFKIDPSQLPVYELALTAPALSRSELRVFADEVFTRELSVVPGVAAVDVSGGLKEEVRVNIDLQRLQAQGIGLIDVLNALEARNEDVSGGRLLGAEKEIITRTVGRFKNAEELNQVSFAVPGTTNRRVYLRDFAQVIDGTERERIFVLLNKQPAVKVSIRKQPDANTINVVDGIKERLALMRTSGVLSEDTVLTPTLDESVFIRSAVADVVNSGLSGTVLAGLAVFLFLRSLRQTFVIVLAIILSSLSAVILMQVFGLSLNLFSLGGLSLGVGIVVDNAIVMLDAITGAKDRQEDPLGSAIRESTALESAILASTTTNLASVVPFLLLGGFIALLFNELILTICFAVAASLVVALTVVPALAARLLKLPIRSGLNDWKPLVAFESGFQRTINGYRRVLSGALKYKFTVVLLVTVILGGGSIFLGSQLPQELLPRISTGQANLFAQFPPGTPLATSRRVMTKVDEIILSQPETAYAFTTTGGALFGNFTNSNPLRGSSTITLKPGSDIDAYVERINKEVEKLNLVGIRIRVNPGQVRGLILNNSPLRGADLDVILQGDDSTRLREAGRIVLKALDEQVTLARFRPEADDQEPEVQIRPNWERAQALGLDTQDIGDTIRTALEGSIPTQLQREERLVDVRVKLDDRYLTRTSDLAQLPLFWGGTQPVRLGDIAEVIEGEGPTEIQRLNQRPSYLIAGNLNEGASLSDGVSQLEATLAELELPEGIVVLPSSASKSNQELQSSLLLLGSLALFLVFAVMAVQYNDLVDPLVILVTVPLALAGGIFGLWVTQTAVGITVLVGVILLVGIVVNNGIVMIELANQLRAEEGLSRSEAIAKAAPLRLRAIIMTALTTVLGLLPLALGLGEGSAFLKPLGIVVFYGVSLATFLTLFIIPCFYVLLHGLIETTPWKKVLP